MRLSEEQVKPGILHGDPRVRFAALEYFTNAFSRDATVMPVAIEAFRQFGRQGAFRFTFSIGDLVQTPETISWAIAELPRLDATSEVEKNLRNSLARLLCNADPELSLPRETQILEDLDFNPDYRQQFARRLKAHAMDDDSCWREIEAICEADKSKFYLKETRYSEAKEFALSLARRGERHVERMMALLAKDVGELENNPLNWMEPLVVYMAGEMRHEPAAPLVIDKLLKDDELLNDECLYALAKIGTDSVVRGIAEAFRSAKWGFRLFAAAVLGRIRSDFAVETAGELLQAEEDDDIRMRLANALADQFSTEGNELARQVLLASPYADVDLRNALLNSCTLLGQDFAELDQWREDAEQARRQAESWQRERSRPRFDEFDADVFDAEEFDADEVDRDFRYDDEPSQPQPVLQSHKGPGRNDPCPCGSGKKYKQCCLRKQATLE